MVEGIQLILTLAVLGVVMFTVPIVLRIRILLRELLQSIVGKVEADEPFIKGLPPEASPASTFLAETVAGAEKEGLDNGMFRGPTAWEPPSDEAKP